MKNTYAEGGELQPEDENGLEGEIPGEVVEDNAEREALEEVEETKDDPVGEPLDVVMGRGRLDSLEREVGRKTPSDEIRNGGSEGVKRVENDDEDETTNNSVSLGDLSALFEVVEDRVLGELRSVSELCLSRKYRENRPLCRAG